MKKLMLIALAMLVAVGAFAQPYQANTLPLDVNLTISPYAELAWVTGQAPLALVLEHPTWSDNETAYFNCASNFGFIIAQTLSAPWGSGFMSGASVDPNNDFGLNDGNGDAGSYTNVPVRVTAMISGSYEWYEKQEGNYGNGTLTLTIIQQ